MINSLIEKKKPRKSARLARLLKKWPYVVDQLAGSFQKLAVVVAPLLVFCFDGGEFSFHFKYLFDKGFSFLV